jgi:hypothetical protein
MQFMSVLIINFNPPKSSDIDQQIVIKCSDWKNPFIPELITGFQIE